MESRCFVSLRASIRLLGMLAFIGSCVNSLAVEPESNGMLNQLLARPLGNPLGLEWEGWLEQGFSWNPDSPADRFNGPVNQNDRANEYQMNQLYLIASKPVDDTSDHWSCGFQADLLYGTDAFFFQALGLDDRIVSDSNSRFYKLALPQLYAELYAPIGSGVTIQLGKWFTPVGYETGLPNDDFFYSKAIGFNNTPYSHTGILMSFDLGDHWSFSHGLHRGTDVWEDNNENLGYCGSAQWANEEESTVCTFAINLGPEQDERADFQDIDGSPGPDAPGENLYRVTYSLTLEQRINERLQYVANHDYFYQEGSETFAIENAEAYGLTQFLIYDYSDCLSLGARLEVYRDDDGFVGSGFRSLNAAAPGVYTNLTLGIQRLLTPSCYVRPEIRWDWQSRDDTADTPAFDDGTSTHQFLVATDLVLWF
ncbi:MAG: porin [Planctomycetota bacterium]